MIRVTRLYGDDHPDVEEVQDNHWIYSDMADLLHQVDGHNNFLFDRVVLVGKKQTAIVERMPDPADGHDHDETSREPIEGWDWCKECERYVP